MKYFVVSDIHSYYDEFIKTLLEKGFDRENEDHTLIVCGDVFDRGPKPIDVMNYLNSLPRVILVKGNHEYLLEEVLQRHGFQSHDIHNGTDKTVLEFLKKNNEPVEGTWYKSTNEILEFFDKFIPYFETEHYIFVHSWIPVDDFSHYKMSSWGLEGRIDYDENWREGNWEEAVWPNPFKYANAGLNKTGKTIVFGHWHCSTGWSIQRFFEGKSNPEFGEDAIWEPYYGEDKEGNKYIGIDRCTAYTGEVNVIIIED